MKHMLAYGALGLACLMLPAAASAQGTPKSVSPATAVDLTKPQFDTQTPHYDVTGASDRAAGTVVAEVGGRTITLGMVGDAIRDLPPTVRNLSFDTVYTPLLKQLTQMQALVVRAQRKGLEKDPAILRRAKLAYDNVLANAILVREAGSSITEKMLLDRYERDYGGKPGPDEADVSIVMLATEAEANAIVAELAGGADFATVARRSSRDSSAQAGGHLGFQPQSVRSPSPWHPAKPRHAQSAPPSVGSWCASASIVKAPVPPSPPYATTCAPLCCERPFPPSPTRPCAT